MISSLTNTAYILLLGLGIVVGCRPQPEPAQTNSFDIQGHRGARGLMPENSIPAFLKALDLGVTTLELDLAVSQDSQLVVSHDPVFNSHICSAPEGEPISEEEESSYRIFQMPYAEVSRFDCGSRGNAQFPEQVPTATYKPLLKTVIDTVEAYRSRHHLPPVEFNIETKSGPNGDNISHPAPETFAQLLYRELQRLHILDRSTVQSFDVRTLQAIHEIDPTVRLVLLVSNTDGLDANLAALGFTPDVYSPAYRLVDADLVEAVHSRGMKLIPWTVNEVDDMRRLKDLGIDGLITDYPNRAQSLLP
jgi:glycerophosphoryl diester phosphodiesterase